MDCKREGLLLYLLGAEEIYQYFDSEPPNLQKQWSSSIPICFYDIHVSSMNSINLCKCAAGFPDILADELLPDLFVYFVRLVTWTKKHTLCGYPGSLSDQIVFSAEKMNYFFL